MPLILHIATQNLQLRPAFHRSWAHLVLRLPNHTALGAALATSWLMGSIESAVTSKVLDGPGPGAVRDAR